MLNMRKLLIVAFVLIGVGLVGSVFTFASKGKTESVTEEVEYDVDNIEQIDIRTDNAKVVILPTNQPSSKLEVTSEGRNYRLTSDVKGDTLSVDMKHKRHRLFNLEFFGDGASLNVYIPEKQYTALKVNSNNGKIEITDINAVDIKVNTDNGKIELQHVNATNIDAETNNGHISLDQVEGKLVGRTNNGAISLNTAHIDRPIDLKTDNGRIEIKTKEDPTNVVFDVKTENGKATIFGESDWNTVIGNGDHLVKLRTANGRITIAE